LGSLTHAGQCSGRELSVKAVNAVNAVKALRLDESTDRGPDA
jgi:hypothetical protein